MPVLLKYFYENVLLDSSKEDVQADAKSNMIFQQT